MNKPAATLATTDRGGAVSASSSAPARGRGRPTTGTRIEVRVPSDVLAAIDEYCQNVGMSRAELVRSILVAWAMPFDW